MVTPLYLSMTWSWVDTEHSLHQVQHPPKIDCLPFIRMIMYWPLYFASAPSLPPYMIDCHQPALHESWRVKLPCYIPSVTSWVSDQYSHSSRWTIHWQPVGTRQNSHDYGLQVRMSMATKCISKLGWVWSSNSLDQGLHVYLQIHLITPSMFTWWWPPRVSPS